MLKKERFVRRPFFVDVVTITNGNMDEAAKWCGGAVETEKQGKREVRFIRVPVHRPMTDKQTKAYPQDKLLRTETGFKVYTEEPFHSSFQPADEVVVNGQKEELPLFDKPKCGRTDRTIDHKPCILDADHGKRACTSIVLEPTVGPPPPLDALNVDLTRSPNPHFPKNYPQASSK